jgi:hypothetical protein
MRTTEAFAAVVREQFKRLVGELPHDTASVTETTERGLLRLRLNPKSTSSSPLEILLEDGAGCTVFVGAHGRFEHLPEDADLVAGFVKAAIYGGVRETVWEWNGHRLRAITKIQIREVPYTHVWGTLIGILTKLMLAPWVRKREIEYQPYTA